MSAARLLTIENLTVSFPAPDGAGRRTVAAGVSFSLHADQTLAVVGESGSGKSVTALAVMGLLPRAACVESGRILYTGDGSETDLLTLDARRLRRIRGGHVAMIFQEPMTSLNPVLTIGDQLIEAVRLHQGLDARAARAAAVHAMDQTGIPNAAARLDAYPHEFSGGMRQRVMIAMALASNPRVLLADEPTTALDVTVQARILDLIHDLRRARGLGIVLITHDLGLVSQRSDVVCVMYRGRVVELGPTREVLSRPLHPYTAALLACAPRLMQRAERLRTVPEIVGDAPPEPHPGVGTPWWPAHEPPADLGPGAACSLVPVAPGRWLGVWTAEGPAAYAPPLASSGARV